MRLNLFRRHRDPTTWPAWFLRYLGPTWSGTPARRLVQTGCLLAFLILFFYVCWPYGARQYAEAFQAREVVDAEVFLWLDPLVGISAALAARILLGSLAAAGVVLTVCLVLPRAFCGYVCPLGTLLDGFDWLLGRRIRLLRVAHPGWWGGLRYYLLIAVLAAAALGVLLSGFVAAIPVLTRALLLLLAPVQMGLGKGWYLVPPWNAGHVLSILLVVVIFCLGLLGRRFWCSNICPTGALFSLGNMLRLSQRTVTDACIRCGQCQKVCSFAAIKDDFSTRFPNCAFCQSCAGVCPVGAIEFTWRWARKRPPLGQGVICSRRGLLAGAGVAAATGAGAALAVEASSSAPGEPPIRPPGSVPEDQFLELCVRCGQCIKVCPNNVLQPAGFEHGFDSLWTPKVVADWSGCEPSCNNCGQVCPTGAVRALTLEEKRAARMALAQVDHQTCLPHAGRQVCQLCADECRMAGYDAIEFVRVGGEVDEKGEPQEGSGLLAPVVREDRCIGCGLCQMRCRAINVKAKRLLPRAAIRVCAGVGKEDRVLTGSYVALREQRARRRRDEERARRPAQDAGNAYLPDFLK
ncbi:MAG: 4Fe-4S binding protein [Planctomycetes bacterium]|jgi:ferredoxin|nr:4Fe-4S binding protein [Planctomycetota bacterium]